MQQKRKLPAAPIKVMAPMVYDLMHITPLKEYDVFYPKLPTDTERGWSFWIKNDEGLLIYRRERRCTRINQTDWVVKKRKLK